MGTTSEHATLNKVNAGALVLATIARGRVQEALEIMDQGDYVQAYDILQEGLSKLQPLVHAQNFVAPFAGCIVVRAADVTPGMVLQGWGEVTGREVDDHACAVPGHVVVTLRFESGAEVAYNSRQELIVETGSHQ